MTCEDFQATQLDKWQGVTSPDADRRLEEHASTCPSCREEASSDVPSVLSLLRRTEDTYEPSSALWNRIEAAMTPASASPTRRTWGIFRVAAALIAAAALFVAWQSTQGTERAVRPTAAVVKDALGSSSPALGTSIAVGTPLTLAAGEATLLDLPNAGRVEIRGPAEVRFDKPLAWTLTRGELTADIIPGRQGFSVSTPCAEVSVTGTVFRVNAAAKGTALTVARGTVRLANAKGAQAVAAKTRSMAIPGAAPSEPTPVEAYALDDLSVGEALHRDPGLTLDAAEDLTLRFHFSSPFARLFLLPPAASPTPYYILNGVDSDGKAFSVRLNDLGGQGNGAMAVEGKSELVQAFKVRSVLPHKGFYLVSGLYVSAGSAAGNPEWQGMVESSPILIEVK